ncbi:sensor histidine kinase [Roseivirga echinicomitans]
MKKNQLYWLLQIGGWGGLHITSFLAIAFMLPFGASVLSTLMSVLCAIFISHLYRLYVKKQKWKDLKIVKLIPRVFFSSLLLGSILATLTFIVGIGSILVLAKLDTNFMDQLTGLSRIEGIDEATLGKLRKENYNFFTSSTLIVMGLSFIVSYSVYFISWSSIYFAYQFLQKNREVEIEKWKLQATVKDAELSALKSQINPHFIFNSLNNIRSLVVEDAEKARDSITHLSDLLRFSIQFDHYEKVSFEKEMEVVAHYLNLESIQLEDRLRYQFLIESESKEVVVPPMLIQTLVENAIKHCINNLPEGGEIIVESKMTTSFLSIFVKNTGQLKGPNGAQRKGIGIGNSRERLRLLYGEEASLSIENMNEHMVCATVKIPLN